MSASIRGSADPGVYRSTWQLQTPDGRRFGSLFYVKIVVPEVSSEVTELPFVPRQGYFRVQYTFRPGILALVDQPSVWESTWGAPRLGCQCLRCFQEYLAIVDDPDFGLHYRSLMIWTTPISWGRSTWCRDSIPPLRLR
jgi:hypothetical protein